MNIKRYSEMIHLASYDERLKYLWCPSKVGRDTFGFDRYLNQMFYASTEWSQIRDFVIARDLGCDLAITGMEIQGKIIVHHMNPLSAEDILHSSDLMLNPDYLVCVSHYTHSAIHYGNEARVNPIFEERKAGDTTLWKTVSSTR